MGHVFRLLFLISHKIPRGIPLVKCPKCGIAERFGVKYFRKNHFSDFKLCIDKELCDFRRKNFFNVFLCLQRAAFAPLGGFFRWFLL